jgi:hypothetical protein
MSPSHVFRAELRFDFGRSENFYGIMRLQHSFKNTLDAFFFLRTEWPSGRKAPHSGRSAAWLARLTGGQEVGGSNPLAPTEERGPVQVPLFF